MFRKTNSLLTRITALLTLVILLSMIIFGFFSYRSEIRLAEESLKTQASIYLQSTADSISSHAAQVELIARQTAFDTRVLSVLESRSIGVYMITLLFRTTDYLNEAEMFLSLLDADLVLLVRDDDVPESYMTAVHLSRLQEDSAFQDFLNSDRLTGWMYTASSPSFMRHSASSLDTLDFYQKVSDGMRTDLGVIRVSVPVRRLFASFDQLPFRGSLDFLYGDTPLLSVSSDAPSGASLLLVQEIPSMNLVLKLHVDLQQAHAAALMRTWTTLAFLLGFGLLLLLICVLALRRILSRVTRMTEAVSKIPEQGRFAVALPEPGEDEAGKLSVAFSDLLNRLEGNYEELLRKEKDKRHALQLALQYQMNPHFLFNSLYWLQLQLEEHSGDLVLSDAVAQLVFAYILDHCERVALYTMGTRLGEWEKSPTFSYFPHPTTELRGKTLGIIFCAWHAKTSAGKLLASFYGGLIYGVYVQQPSGKNSSCLQKHHHLASCVFTGIRHVEMYSWNIFLCEGGTRSQCFCIENVAKRMTVEISPFFWQMGWHVKTACVCWRRDKNACFILGAVEEHLEKRMLICNARSGQRHGSATFFTQTFCPKLAKPWTKS